MLLETRIGPGRESENPVTQLWTIACGSRPITALSVSLLPPVDIGLAMLEYLQPRSEVVEREAACVAAHANALGGKEHSDWSAVH